MVGVSCTQGPLLLLQAGRRSWLSSPPSLVGPFRPRLRVPRQRHAAAAVLLSRCTLAAPLRGPFPAVAPLRSPLRFVLAVCRCVRFFCSFVAAVRSTPSGEGVVGVRAPWPPFSPARVSGRGFSRSAKPGAPSEFFFALADSFGGASLRKKMLKNCEKW